MTEKDRQTMIEQLDALETMLVACLECWHECSRCPVRYICKEVYGNDLTRAAVEIGKQAEQQTADHAEELRAKRRKREVTKVLTVQITSVRRLQPNVILSKANRDEEKKRQEELARKIKDVLGCDDVTVLTKQVFYKDE